MIQKLIDQINTDFNYEEGKGIATTISIIMLLDNLFQDDLISKANLLDDIKQQLWDSDQNS